MKVADEWFAFETVDEGVTRIWEPWVHDLMQANVWHVRGREADLLVDAGMGVGDLADALRRRGLTGDRPLLLTVTHCHADHVGSAHQFWPRAVHLAEAALLARPSTWHPLLAEEYETDLAAYFGGPDGLEPADGSARGTWDAASSGLVVGALPAPDFDPAAFTVPAAAPTVQLQEGDVVDLGDRAWRVMHLPGHSPGGIGLWDERAGILFSGDVVYDEGMLLDELTGSSIPEYLATMERLRGLPVERVYAGHGRPFGRAQLHERIDAYLEWRGGRTQTSVSQKDLGGR
jgi:glyoxylase-like metal-dependent hydrolase (beta-lactamase superfamily II)